MSHLSVPAFLRGLRSSLRSPAPRAGVCLFAVSRWPFPPAPRSPLFCSTDSDVNPTRCVSRLRWNPFNLQKLGSVPLTSSAFLLNMPCLLPCPDHGGDKCHHDFDVPPPDSIICAVSGLASRTHISPRVDCIAGTFAGRVAVRQPPDPAPPRSLQLRFRLVRQEQSGAQPRPFRVLCPLLREPRQARAGSLPGPARPPSTVL